MGYQQAMELRHLRYFLVVAETENIRRASEILNIAQPAISRQIQDLELDLGVELFERLPRGLRLNAAGKAYKQDISKIFESLEAANKHARRTAAGQDGELRLGYVEIAAWTGAVPVALQAFTEAYPNVRVELLSANTPRQLALVDRGELDGAFVYPVDTIADHFVAQDVRYGKLVVAIPQHWKNRVSTLPLLHDLAHLPFIGFRRDEHPAYFDCIMKACRDAGVTPQFIQEEPNEGAMLSLVSAGIGIAIVNDANMDRPPPLVAFLRPKDLTVSLKLKFVHRADNHNPALPLLAQRLNDVQTHLD